jgi:hypothetical protein
MAATTSSPELYRSLRRQAVTVRAFVIIDGDRAVVIEQAALMRQ